MSQEGGCNDAAAEAINFADLAQIAWKPGLSITLRLVVAISHLCLVTPSSLLTTM